MCVEGLWLLQSPRANLLFARRHHIVRARQRALATPMGSAPEGFGVVACEVGDRAWIPAGQCSHGLVGPCVRALADQFEDTEKLGHKPVRPTTLEGRRRRLLGHIDELDRAADGLSE